MGVSFLDYHEWVPVFVSYIVLANGEKIICTKDNWGGMSK